MGGPSGVAGFIQPRDSVDVLITRQLPEGSQEVTDVLLQNVHVIAMGEFRRLSAFFRMGRDTQVPLM